MAVALFQNPNVKGEVEFRQKGNGTMVNAFFTELPTGKHGFHIHKAGDLRGEGCQGACDHWHKGKKTNHGGPPGKTRKRHTGDLGNIEKGKNYSFFLRGVKVNELYGRSVIVHADEDDLGKGSFPDSLTTGHSGGRIGCAIIGRVVCGSIVPKRRRISRTRRMKQ